MKPIVINDKYGCSRIYADNSFPPFEIYIKLMCFFGIYIPPKEQTRKVCFIILIIYIIILYAFITYGIIHMFIGEGNIVDKIKQGRSVVDPKLLVDYLGTFGGTKLTIKLLSMKL